VYPQVVDFLMKQAMFDSTGFGSTPLGGLSMSMSIGD